MASTVGDARDAIAALIGVPRDDIRHYAMVIETWGGTVLNFCCDDHIETAGMLTGGADLLLFGPPSGRPPTVTP